MLGGGTREDRLHLHESQWVVDSSVLTFLSDTATPSPYSPQPRGRIASYFPAENRLVVTYLSPVSARITTMFLPSASTLPATARAA